jgi:transposase
VTIRFDGDTPGYARHVADREGFDVLPVEEKDGESSVTSRRRYWTCCRCLLKRQLGDDFDATGHSLSRWSLSRSASCTAPPLSGMPTTVISRRRRLGDPPAPAGSPVSRRGNRRRAKPPDPNGRHRWPVERTNAWLRNWRRVATRWEREPDYWLAVIQTAAAMVAWQMLEHSFR